MHRATWVVRTLPFIVIALSLSAVSRTPVRAQGPNGQGVSVAPTALTFDSPSAASQSVTASINFDGAIRATTSNPGVCTVSPGSAGAQVTPKAGGTKTALFQVSPVGSGDCTVTLTDKKGNTAAVTVTVDAVDEGDDIVYTATWDIRNPQPIFVPYTAANVTPYLSNGEPAYPFFCNGGGGPDFTGACQGDINIRFVGGTAPYYFAGTSGNCGAGVFPLPGDADWYPQFSGYRVTGTQVISSQFNAAIGYNGPAPVGNACVGTVTDSTGLVGSIVISEQ